LVRFAVQGKRRRICAVSTRPVIIGVAGGSGSGKTTVVRRIVSAIGTGHVSVLDHDRYYFDHPNLRLEDRAGLNFDHPSSLDTALLVEHVRALKDGQAVEVPVYDFARHVRQAATQTILSLPTIIVEGILVFENGPLRALMDVKVFVDADDDTRFIRRLRRDITERGRTMESVIDQYLQTVKPMHLEFVEPTKRYADLIIPQGGHNEVAVGLLLSLIRGMARGERE
jgi:uridine kinase